MTAGAQLRRGVLLDRDGTLVDFVRDPELGCVFPAFHPDQLRLLPGVLEGLHALADAGFVLAVASNQPDAAKGRVPRQAIERTHQALLERLAREGVPVAASRLCLHHPEGGPGGDPALIRPCPCRKPQPGMLLELCRELGLDRARSWMVGDTAADLGAGRAAGLRCGVVAPVRRCEICPLDGADLDGARPDLCAARFDELARKLIAASAG